MASTSEQFSTSVMPYYLPFVAALVLLVGVLASALIPGLWEPGFFAEHGPLETASFLLYLVGAAGFLWLWPRMALGGAWHVTALLLLFAARELDWDKKFTDKGVLQSALYTGDYPLMQKLAGGAVILLVLAILYRFLRHGAGPFFRALRGGELWAWSAFAAVMITVATKSVDGIDRKLTPMGIDLGPGLIQAFAVAEESGELLSPLLLALSLCSWVAHKQRS